MVPVLQLCYLYADVHKQTSSRESRRFFAEFHSLFVDRAAVSFSSGSCVCVFVPLGPRFRLVDSFAYFARCPLQNLKVPVPEAVAAELGEAIEL